MSIAERIIEFLFDILNFIFEILEFNGEDIENIIRRIIQDQKRGRKIIALIEFNKSTDYNEQAC